MMLTYNFHRIFRARAIDKPYAFLKTYGFSDNFASTVKQNRVKRLNNRDLEKLCVALRCTPNDLLEWTEDDNYELDETHPMRKLIKLDDFSDITRAMSSIPLDKIEEVHKLISDKLKDFKD